MQNYINQLIQDFNLAEEDPTQETNFGDTYDEFEKQMLEIEESRYEPAKQVVGVSYVELPPAERMTVAQTQELTIAMLNALSAKGTNVIFPGDGIPAKLAYEQLRKHFKEGFHAVSGWNIDFCDGDCPSCAFVDYCKAKDDIWTAEELKKEMTKRQ
ncbi:MAG: hypothetical protein DRI86_08085 [Bacteroidetes bacterium]|nr:MAG: hypothetical protein DRI86_08085 [Bacteroidota bacterium]